jgi:heat shock protein HtpX
VAHSSSIAWRATVSLALLIGFCVLAIGVAALLLIIAYIIGEQSLAHNTLAAAKLVIFLVIGAFVILWSIRPRFDRFTPPEPLLAAGTQPALFRMIADVSLITGESMPAAVYLVLDVNAYVANRGGILGIGSKRIMGLGLPLMRFLSVKELEAVLAHEFGHFYGGNTRLGPVVYNMRGAILRTVAGLAGGKSILAYLHKPFLWYGEGALRIAQGVSRSQEYAADQLAARTFGAKPLATGLCALHSASVAYVPYVQEEYVPVLDHCARPPFADSFASYLARTDVSAEVSSALIREMKEGETSPYDNHPPLRDRLAQLETSSAKSDSEGSTGGEDPPAISLLSNLGDLESDLLVFLTGNIAIKNYRPVAWGDVRIEVYVRSWREFVAEHADKLRGIHPTDFRRIAKDIITFMRKFTPSNELPPANQLRERGGWILGVILANALYLNGWTLLPATATMKFPFQKESWTIDPFQIAAKFSQNQINESDWIHECQKTGMAEWDLSETAKP